MGPSRIIILAVSAIAAIGIAVIVRGMAGRHASAAAPVAVVADRGPVQNMTQVLVAKHDLAVGTRLTAADLGWQAWPSGALNSAFITDGHGAQPAPTTPVATAAAKAGQVAHVAATAVAGGGPMEALYGAIVRQPILASEPISNAKLVRGGEGGYMAVVLDPGMRAIAIPVNVNTAAGGFILPGDRVDVMQSHPTDAASNGGHAGFVAATLMRNVRVLAIDQASAPLKNGQSMVGAVATLEVASGDAEIVARAKAQGEIILALRAYSDTHGPSGRVGGGDAGTVRIIRNGQASEVMVAP